jgi:hypothetical protein
MRLIEWVSCLVMGLLSGIGASVAITALGYGWPIALVLELGLCLGVAMSFQREKGEACAAVSRHFCQLLSEQGFIVDANGKIWKKDTLQTESRSAIEAAA